MTESFAEKMKAGTRELNITLSQRQLEQFFKYYEMLVETNKVMNLTAITEEGTWWQSISVTVFAW